MSSLFNPAIIGVAINTHLIKYSLATVTCNETWSKYIHIFMINQHIKISGNFITCILSGRRMNMKPINIHMDFACIRNDTIYHFNENKHIKKIHEQKIRNFKYPFFLFDVVKTHEYRFV